MRRYPFSVDPTWRLPLRLIGVRPSSAYVEVDDEFMVRFGPWTLRTPMSNVAGATVTGPFSVWKVLGPHLSLADRGVTFGTNGRQGVCVRFHRPVSALAPGKVLTHPGVTVTVADPESLAEHLNRLVAVVPG
ncbi:hypothetical protein AB0K60_19195 [Thermopolyspora sp. NPDC052614]|uniref:hypothetical protein n=1 Tax=Thermopolyspora sp. NPDC052614 TaxID=3155682 RepID=UPI003430FAAB